MSNRRPDPSIHVLLWDYSVLYALDREPLPNLNLGWMTPPGIHVCLDDVLPLGSCHHQKIVVVDDAVAFCGGLDLAVGRWDTSDTAPVIPSGSIRPARIVRRFTTCRWWSTERRRAPLPSLRANDGWRPPAGRPDRRNPREIPGPTGSNRI